MKILDVITEDLSDQKNLFVNIVSKFLPIAVKYIELKDLPRIVWQINVHSDDQPTFGKYMKEENTLYVAVSNRHPNDVLRTLAHELVHYKQDIENKLTSTSGDTGSDIENEAHAIAGIVMRHFNKKYPEFLKSKPLVFESLPQKL